jgi:hypothetical protein
MVNTENTAILGTAILAIKNAVKKNTKKRASI